MGGSLIVSSVQFPLRQSINQSVFNCQMLDGSLFMNMRICGVVEMAQGRLFCRP